MSSAATAPIHDFPAATWRWPAVVETIRSMKPLEIVTALAAAVSALGIVGGFILYLSGAFAGATIAAHDLAAIKSQVADISTQVARLQDRLDGGPRADQLHVIDLHLSAQDGRMDAIDTRIRDVESRLTRAQTMVDSIAQASQPGIGRR